MVQYSRGGVIFCYCFFLFSPSKDFEVNNGIIAILVHFEKTPMGLRGTQRGREAVLYGGLPAAELVNRAVGRLRTVSDKELSQDVCASTNCPSDPLVLIPHREHCTMYYNCTEGTPVETPCPQGLYFSTELLTCVMSQHSDCYKGTRSARRK